MKSACLIEVLYQPEFPKLYLELIRSIVDFDSSAIMVYGVNPRPKILHDEIAEDYRDLFYNKYVQRGAFLLSPLYQTFRAGKQGIFRLKDIVADDFFDSEYYQKYYGYSGLVDQVFCLKRFCNDIAIVVSLGRTEKFNAYTKLEINNLELFQPFLISLIAKNWEYLGSEKSSFSSYLHKAFENFGCSLLTVREKEVVDCMLRGCGSKSVAKELNISPETERSYRKSIYQKLNVHSHSQLYYLFFLSLDFAENARGDDPLKF